MNAGLTRQTRSDVLRSRSVSPIGDSNNAFNHCQDSFNYTITHHHHYPSRDRRTSFTPTLASVASEDSSTPKSTHHGSPLSDGIAQVECRDVNQDTEQATRTPVASNTEDSSRVLASPDEIIMKDRSVHQGYEQSEVSFRYQASASQVVHPGNAKTRSRLSTILNLSARFGRGSLWSKHRPPNTLRSWTEFNNEEVDDYVPEGMDKKYRNYMRSRHLAQSNAIPVWNPSPIRGVNVRRRIRIDVGDVGTFTMRGGFRVAFNILLSEKINKLCGYDVPKNFSPLTPEQAEGCSIKDDGTVVDLDDCGAIVSEEVNCSGTLSYGFDQRSCASSEPFTTRCDISPKAKKDKRRGYVHLPQGARVYSLNSTATDDLTAYLNESLPVWLDYLERLWYREKAPPIIVTAVWAARSFACATYTVNPPKTSATAQVWTASKGEQINWTHVSEGFETARAPLGDGYDGNAKLKSPVEDQCFAIEGHVLKSQSLKKEISKWRASLPVIS